MAALRARGVVKRFGATTALDEVDLSVEPGEVRGLLGPNGAGKTTLLRVLLGLVRADAGTVELLGRSGAAGHRPPGVPVAGFTETPSFYPYLSGRVNLELLARLDGTRAAVRAGAIAQAVERVGLGARIDERTGGYSTGMRQRLAIAACLLAAPRVLLLDEPTSGLDPQGARDVLSLVREVAAEGVAVLISSHQMADVEQLCHTFTFLRRGEVVWDGTAADLNAQARTLEYRVTTSDDPRALELASAQPGVRAQPDPGEGLTVAIEGGSLDAYVIALGRAGVAVRRLEQRVSPVEAMFFSLTGQHEDASPGDGRVDQVGALR